jgi:hypothetical protein
MRLYRIINGDYILCLQLRDVSTMYYYYYYNWWGGVGLSP